MKPLTIAVVDIRVPTVMLADMTDGEASLALGNCVVERMLLDIQMEPDLVRYQSVTDHADRLSKGIAYAFRHRTKSKVSASGDRVGSSVLHYIDVTHASRDVSVTIRSVISDAKVAS